MPRSISCTDRIASGKPAKRVWGFALLIAIAFHAAGFAAARSGLAAEDEADPLGAPAIEIGLDLTAPREAETNLPPGPEADASAASSAAVDQKAKAERTDLPKDRPVETDDPDRVAAPDAAKTPRDNKPNVQDAKANPTADSVASEALAPPSVENAREAPRSAAPAQGTGDSLERVKTTWQRKLAAHLNRFKHYPGTVSPRGMTVVLTFTLDRLGHVSAATLRQSSGDRAFDQAALAMMTRADPVPPPPPAIADDGLTFTMPVVFREKKR
jgi:TonB family protein